MAVYTKVDDKTLADFLSRYDVGTALSFKGIAEGIENSNYLLETTQDRFILTLYEKRTKEEDLPYFLGMMAHAARAGLPSALPIHDKSGLALQTLKGKNACLISFLSGVSVDDIQPGHCRKLGEALARLHKAWFDFKPIRANEIGFEGWQHMAKATAACADDLHAGLKYTIACELDYLANTLPKNLPTGTIHADLFPDNVLFTGDKITGLIDFYFGCTDQLAYDLAICINAWCFDEHHTFVPARARAMIEEYDQHRTLTPEERTALPILCRGAAMRFLLTRLYDYQNPVSGAVVSPKNPLDYLKRLEFHQQIKETDHYVV